MNKTSAEFTVQNSVKHWIKEERYFGKHTTGTRSYGVNFLTNSQKKCNRGVRQPWDQKCGYDGEKVHGRFAMSFHQSSRSSYCYSPLREVFTTISLDTRWIL